MIIRRATEKDLPALLVIEDRCFGNERFNRDVLHAYVSRQDSFTVIALEGQRPQGSAMCTMPQRSMVGRIASIAVLEDKRRSGIGSLLLAECERVLKTEGRKYAMLEVEVSNEPAIALYKGHGYKITGLIEQYYSRDRDAYVMEKRI
ncbi:MAG TPA: N-acetyltransferase [Thermoplasmata archaeon]|nr:N-acetyltransferase [Thermoplasmata archaeon]